MDQINFNLISAEELEGAALIYYEDYSAVDSNVEDEPLQSTSQFYDLDNYHSDDDGQIQSLDSTFNSDFQFSLSVRDQNSNAYSAESHLLPPVSSSRLQQDFEVSTLNEFPPSSPAENETEEQDEDEEQACVVVRNSRKRKKKANPEEWKNNMNKKKRALGQEYVGKTKFINDQGQIHQPAAKSARKMGPSCNSKRCKNITCSELRETEREIIFNNFWEMSWNEKKTFVCSLVDTEEPTKRSKVRSFDKENNMIYFLKNNNMRTKVCRKMFLSTLGMGRGQVYNWLKKNNNNNIHPTPGPSKQILTTTTTTRNLSDTAQLVQRRSFLTNFFERLPKCPSHYCRSDSTKIYLEPLVKTKRQLKKLYNEECKKINTKPFSRPKFERIFSQLNLSLFKPKKDLCNICVQYELHHVSDEIYKTHQQRKNDARNEKKLDKNLAKAGTCHTLSMDLQQVKLCPTLQASASFFKQKLSCHNFTIYNLSTRDATCYWWSEIDADCTASPFASCITHYLENNCVEPALPTNLYSDGCGYQNRNCMLSSALLSFAVQNNTIVTQKFLEKGHTQMEVDSVHSTIECKLKNEDIYLPSQFSELSKVARSTGNPYEVNEVKYDFFSDYSDKTKMVYSSIRPGKEKVHEIRSLKYCPDGSILYKLNYLDDYKNLPLKSSRPPPLSFPKLYQEPPKITDKKYSDLQDLKEVIPSEFHSFYNNLPKGKIPKKKK